MADTENRTSRAREIQVFELTMDNTEDQDELNRRFRKPGELDAKDGATLTNTGNAEPPNDTLQLP
jgi:hypothetical protein